jgi:urease accessory protein
MKSRTLFVGAAICAFLAATQVAFSHPGPAGHAQGGLSAGFAHPLSGVDHALAMIAVGLLAARGRGRSMWLLPLTFIALMVVGGMLALAGMHVPMIEQGIAASVLVLGILVALATGIPLGATLGLVGLFAIFHGYAHVIERDVTQSFASYAFGFILATALLHGVGIAIGLAASRPHGIALWRLGGAAIAGTGLLLLLNVV